MTTCAENLVKFASVAYVRNIQTGRQTRQKKRKTRYTERQTDKLTDKTDHSTHATPTSAVVHGQLTARVHTCWNSPLSLSTPHASSRQRAADEMSI